MQLPGPQLQLNYSKLSHIWNYMENEKVRCLFNHLVKPCKNSGFVTLHDHLRKKTSFSFFKDPGTLMNSHFYQHAGLAGSPPTTFYLPKLLEMKCEKWANLQLRAVFLRDRDIKMKYREYVEVDWERWEFLI